MFDFLKKWLNRDAPEPDARPAVRLRQSGTFVQPQFDRRKGERRKSDPQPALPPEPKAAEQEPDTVELDPQVDGHIEDAGPGKNVLIRNRYLREDTGTHETLKILDDSLVDSGEETGIDPYNTGNFDRSKNWDKRFRN